MDYRFVIKVRNLCDMDLMILIAALSYNIDYYYEYKYTMQGDEDLYNVIPYSYISLRNYRVLMAAFAELVKRYQFNQYDY